MSLPVLYLDNSTAKTMARCSTEAWLHYHLGYQSREGRAALVSGSAGHAALKAWLTTWDVGFALSVFEYGDDEGSPAYRQWATDHDVPADDRLHPDNCVKVIREYCTRHPASAYPFIVEPSLLEIGFKVEVAPGLVAVGKLDGLVRDRETRHWHVLEHKFTGSITAKWLAQYKIDSQVSTYLHGAQEHLGAERVVGAFINAIELSRLPSDPTRKCRGSAERGIEAHGVPYSECGHLHLVSRLTIATRTPAQLESWKRSMQSLATRFDKLRRAYPTLEYLEYVPQEGTFHNACTFCDFYDFCSTGRPRDMVDTMLVHDPWSPYEHAFGAPPAPEEA